MVTGDDDYQEKTVGNNCIMIQLKLIKAIGLRNSICCGSDANCC